jgi:hypothetical protein
MNTGIRTTSMNITGAAARVNPISPDCVAHPMRNRTTPISRADVVYPKFMVLILPQKQASRKTLETLAKRAFSRDFS